jgi:hypothetical protein
VLLFSGAVLGGHGNDVRVVIPAVVVMAGGVGLVSSSAWQLNLVSELDWSGPVVAIQAGLERLRAARLRQLQWVLLLAPLVGFCGLLVSLTGVSGWWSGGRMDVLERMDQRWLVANYVFGLVFVPAGHVVARALAARLHGREWWIQMLDGMSGRDLGEATREVDRWERVGRGVTGEAQ